MIKTQEGDLITVQAESVKHQFMESGDFESVLIESGDSGGPLNDLEAWSKKQTADIDVFGKGEILTVETCVSRMQAMRATV